MKIKLFLPVILLLSLRLNAAPLFSGFLDIKTGFELSAVETGVPETGENNNKIKTGFEAYANLRLDEKLRDNLRFYSAFNAAAAQGIYAEQLAFTGANVQQSNYLSALELERLYIRVSEDKWGLDLGLMPLHFGFGAVFGPSDFLIKRNPAISDARSRGILGEAFYFYPADDIRIFQFASYPEYPAAAFEFSGGHLGAGFDAHFEKASIEAFYSYKTPDAAPSGIHYFGGSFKADLEIAFFIDALYKLYPENENNIQGLAVSAGLDYTFFDGKLYALCEYLFDGKKSAYIFRNQNYLDALLRYTVSDLINITAQSLFGIDDMTMIAMLIYSQELAQGITLTLNLQVPLDLENISDKYGEFSPIADSNSKAGSRFSFTGKVRIKL